MAENEKTPVHAQNPEQVAWLNQMLEIMLAQITSIALAANPDHNHIDIEQETPETVTGLRVSVLHEGCDVDQFNLREALQVFCDTFGLEELDSMIEGFKEEYVPGEPYDEDGYDWETDVDPPPFQMGGGVLSSEQVDSLMKNSSWAQFISEFGAE